MDITISLTGNTTVTGATAGAETFRLTGINNRVNLAGANDMVQIRGGGHDAIDLNATGFTTSVTDSLALGASANDNILASHALANADITITGGTGGNTIALVNAGGTTALALGGANQPSLQPCEIALNGNARNSVSFDAQAGDAVVNIGSPHDGDTGFTSSVGFSGGFNRLFGGDESFTVTATGGQNVITLGNGNNDIALTGNRDQLALGTGDNSITLAGAGQIFLANMVNGGTDHITLSAGPTQTQGWGYGGDLIFGGNENVNVTASGTLGATIALGDGDDTLTLASGRVLLGDSTANTASDQVSFLQGGAQLALLGGIDTVLLGGETSTPDRVFLDGTKLGTSLTAQGSFDSILLAAGADAAITEATGANGLHLTIQENQTFGIGTLVLTGLAQDPHASIDLVGRGTYTVSHDTTGIGITLNFAQGSIDLVGLTTLPPGLITITHGGPG